MYNLYCIACPAGCEMEVIGTGKHMVVNGHKCDKGKEFAIAEISQPMRVLTTTVRTNFPDIPVISVRTAGEIPKGMLMRAMNALNDIVIKDELACGDVVVENLLGSGVSVILTSGALKQVGAELENKNAQLSGDITQNPPEPTSSSASSDTVITVLPGVTAGDEDAEDAENEDGIDEDSDEEDLDWRRGRAQIRR